MYITIVVCVSLVLAGVGGCLHNMYTVYTVVTPAWHRIQCLIALDQPHEMAPLSPAQLSLK